MREDKYFSNTIVFTKRQDDTVCHAWISRDGKKNWIILIYTTKDKTFNLTYKIYKRDKCLIYV